MNELGMLTALIALPLVGGILLALLPGLRPEPARILTFALMLVTFLLSLALLAIPAGSSWNEGPFPWVPRFGISYLLGADGIAALLILLTTLLAPLVLLASYGHVHDRIRQHCVLLLLMEAGVIGVFCALDLVLFYVFFEMSLIPLYFLVGIYGGARRVYAAFKFVIFTMAGSLLMLLGILYLIHKTGSAAYPDLLRVSLSATEQFYLFWAFAAAFAVKVPLVPFHTWLPDAHVEAPTGGSVILAGVTLKMGTYGLLRFALPLFPAAAVDAVPWFLALSVIGILYGALLAWAQRDMKKLIAYSSISHMGFVVLGLFALTGTATSGAVLQMVNHGIATGALFLLVGMLYERAHRRGLDDFGGLAQTMPVFSVFLVLATLSSIGLPGLNGFVGEFLILLGTFRDHPVAAALASLGVLLGAIYMLGLLKAVLFGPVRNHRSAAYSDLTIREVSMLCPLVILMFWIGLFPGPLLRRIEPCVNQMLEAPQLELSRHREEASPVPRTATLRDGSQP